jgi:hypothetical protein
MMFSMFTPKFSSSTINRAPNFRIFIPNSCPCPPDDPPAVAKSVAAPKIKHPQRIVLHGQLRRLAAQTDGAYKIGELPLSIFIKNF